jgi:serine protease Do
MSTLFFHSRSRISARVWRVLTLALTLSWALLAWSPATCQAQEKKPLIYVAHEGTPATPPPNLETAVEKVAKTTIPAVVHIIVTERQEVQNPFYPFQENPLFRQFFGTRKMPRKFKRELKGLGTGMILDNEGYILTNNHVAGGATKIEVTLADGAQYPASLVGADPKTDLAVIRIHAKDPLPHVVFGNSDKTKVGQWVIAIGHPRGLYQTVTQGIISAKHRTGIMDPSNYQDYLQTDAAINPGNSGGPLLTLGGDVIGVNSAIESTSGGFQGIGFAIPSRIALHIARQLIAHGKVERGWLGVSVQDLTPALGKTFGVENTQGALISKVVNNSPAARAGLKRGDIIIAYDGQSIPDASTLRNDVATTTIGQEARLTLLRNGKRRELTVKIGNLAEEIRFLTQTAEKRLGAKFTDVPQREAVNYGIESDQGVKIIQVDSSGPLGKAGFEVGDLILQVNGQTVAGVESFDQLVAQFRPGQQVDLVALDHRTGEKAEVTITVH